MKNKAPQMRAWKPRDSEDLYLVRLWGRGFIRVGDEGHVQIDPLGPDGPSVDLHQLVCDLVERGVTTPLLLRFPGVLRGRIESIHGAFAAAMKHFGYSGCYRGVFPVKVNQQRHVVEEIVEFGRECALGLEAGSKPELMIALAMHEGADACIVCNGIKDGEYIELALLATKLGKRTIIVADRLEEVRLAIEVSRELGVKPSLGVRVRLASRGAGKWNESTGDRSKFGLSASELVEAVELLRGHEMLDCLELLHFHIGSQITDIQAIKHALREATRVYTELAQLGAPMGSIDVGGGLGVDYDGSQTNYQSSMNYSLQEYANDVVAAVQDACDAASLPHPEIISESGRAIVAHHSVFVMNVVGTTRQPSESDAAREIAQMREAGEEASGPVEGLQVVFEGLTRRNAIEFYHDALQIRDEAQSLFDLGYLDLRGRARCENLFWGSCNKILRLLGDEPELPEELHGLLRGLADIYYCNWSTFQSTPDNWAVKQLFPTLPIHRLGERPSRRAILGDLTCDSDGKMDRFIDHKDVAQYLYVHEPNGEPYYLAFFLVGAYQEVLGDLHNLFGDTNVVHVSVDEDGGIDVGKVVDGDSVREVLTYVQYDPDLLIERLRKHGEAALRSDRISKLEFQQLLSLYKAAMARTTYLS